MTNEADKPTDATGIACRIDGLVGPELRSMLGGIRVEHGAGIVDNLAIVLCTYFSDHLDRPEDDTETEHGWGEWVERKTDEALDLIAAALPPNSVLDGRK